MTDLQNVTPAALPAARVLDQVNPGGLFRCCTETIGDLYPNGPAQVGTEGQILQCKYAPDSPNHRMIFRAGVWQWFREET